MPGISSVATTSIHRSSKPHTRLLSSIVAAAAGGTSLPLPSVFPAHRHCSERVISRRTLPVLVSIIKKRYIWCKRLQTVFLP